MIQNKAFQVSFLRFHVHSDACMELIKCENIDVAQHEILTQFSQLNIKRRKYALLGQAILQDYYCLQTTDCFIAILKEVDSINSIKSLNSVLKIEGLKGVNLWSEVFSNVEDADHDGEDFHLSLDSSRIRFSDQ